MLRQEKWESGRQCNLIFVSHLNFIFACVNLVEPWKRAVTILPLLAWCLACKSTWGMAFGTVPVLGKAMRMEDWTRSRERAALLSSPCSDLAWLGFLEPFWQHHWDNNIQFAGAEESCIVPSSSRRVAKAVPPAQGGPACTVAWQKARMKCSLWMLNEEEKPCWNSRWWEFY